MSNAEIVPIGDKRVATSTDFESPGDRLIAMAVENGADVDKLEKLIALKNHHAPGVEAPARCQAPARRAQGQVRDHRRPMFRAIEWSTDVSIPSLLPTPIPVALSTSRTSRRWTTPS